MKKGFEKGALVMLTRATNPLVAHMVGTPRTLNSPTTHPDGHPSWSFDPPVIIRFCEVFWTENSMVLINPGNGTDEMLDRAGKPAPASKRLTEAEFEAAQDRWIQGVDA